MPTINQVLSFAQAVLLGKKVTQEIADERYAICQKCEHRGVDKHKHEFCRICGCQLSKSKNRIRNIVAYIENLPKWGCKHPSRERGNGWKM